MSDVIPGTYQIDDNQFAAKAFSVNTGDPNQAIDFTGTQISGTTGLSITATEQSGQHAALFLPGEKYELSWLQGTDGRTMLGTVTRSDTLVTGQELVVFTGVVAETGETFTLVVNLSGPMLSSTQAQYYTNDRFETTVGVCLTAGCLVETPGGQRPVEALVAGDLVCTLDRGPQPVRWIGRRRLGARELAANPRLRPVRIAAGAMGQGLPARDLRVSAQHRMLLRSRIAGRMHGAEEVLVAAVHLAGLPGIARDEAAQQVEYLHLMFDRHEVIFAEGAPTESLLLGPMARKGIPAAALDELLAIFPELAGAEARPEPARRLLAGARARDLAARHLRHARALLERGARARARPAGA